MSRIGFCRNPWSAICTNGSLNKTNSSCISLRTRIATSGPLSTLVTWGASEEARKWEISRPCKPVLSLFSPISIQPQTATLGHHQWKLAISTTKATNWLVRRAQAHLCQRERANTTNTDQTSEQLTTAQHSPETSRSSIQTLIMIEIIDRTRSRPKTVWASSSSQWDPCLDPKTSSGKLTSILVAQGRMSLIVVSCSSSTWRQTILESRRWARKSSWSNKKGQKLEMRGRSYKVI